MLPGIKLKTSPTDYFPNQAMRLQKFNGEIWELFGDTIGADWVLLLRALTFVSARALPYGATNSTRLFNARPASFAFDPTGARCATPAVRSRGAPMW